MTGGPDDIRPASSLVAEIDLADPLPELPRHDERGIYTGAWVLVKLHTRPIGIVRFEYSRRPTRALLAEAICRSATELGILEEVRNLETLREQLHAGDGLGVSARSAAYLKERAEVLREGPTASVVVCTRNRPHLLATCLQSLVAQRYPRFEIVVVDNTDGDGAVKDLVSKLAHAVAIECVIERRPGLSRARNRGTTVAAGDVVAFLDDDATADPFWLAELIRPYTRDKRVASVNGLILPAELRTPAQEWLTRYGGHSKGRGFVEEVFDAGNPAGQSPLYPLPPFGAGGNMSFDRRVLGELGGFDEALGAGTLAGGAEETLQFTRLLLDGHRIVYQPSAFVWHRDHAAMEEIAHQIQALGTSITAYYTALLWSQPSLVFQLARLAPRGLRELMTGKRSVRKVTMGGGYPRHLLRAHRRGLALGPTAYMRGRLAKRRQHAPPDV